MPLGAVSSLETSFGLESCVSADTLDGLSPSSTVKVEFSFTVPESSRATGSLLPCAAVITRM